MRRAALCLVAVLLVGCATTVPAPTKERPLTGCSVTCTKRFISERQLQCQGKRRFQDILITGRYTRRGADGTVIMDMWTTPHGDYPVRRVVLGTCSAYIAREIAARDIEHRGQRPGEDEQGRPTGPP